MKLEEREKRLLLNFCLEIFLEECPNHVKVWTRFSNLWYRKMEIICFSILVKTRKSGINYEQKDVMCSSKCPGDWNWDESRSIRLAEVWDPCYETMSDGQRVLKTWLQIWLGNFLYLSNKSKKFIISSLWL